jgi:hypothetical protein
MWDTVPGPFLYIFMYTCSCVWRPHVQITCMPLFGSSFHRWPEYLWPRQIGVVHPTSDLSCTTHRVRERGPYPSSETIQLQDWHVVASGHILIEQQLWARFTELWASHFAWWKIAVIKDRQYLNHVYPGAFSCWKMTVKSKITLIVISSADVGQVELLL